VETGADKHLAEFWAISDALVTQTIDEYQSRLRDIPECLKIDRQVTIIDIGHVSHPGLRQDDRRHQLGESLDIRGR